MHEVKALIIALLTSEHFTKWGRVEGYQLAAASKVADSILRLASAQPGLEDHLLAVDAAMAAPANPSSHLQLMRGGMPGFPSPPDVVSQVGPTTQVRPAGE